MRRERNVRKKREREQVLSTFLTNTVFKRLISTIKKEKEKKKERENIPYGKINIEMKFLKHRHFFT